MSSGAIKSHVGEIPDVSSIAPIELNDTTARVKSSTEMRTAAESYRRYHIVTEDTPDLQPLPDRFIVKVGRIGLAKLLVKEFFQYFGKWDVVFSRPCVYGVFSGPVGGFKPRPNLCVGCLRCTIQHPEFVTILPNPKLDAVGDEYFDAKKIQTVHLESSNGAVPVKGQGYRGRFGGVGWDGMWTDMSEIVRPTRDGIHGRETISTLTDIGSRPMNLQFSVEGDLVGSPTVLPRTTSIELPLLFDIPPLKNIDAEIGTTFARAADNIGSIAILPYGFVREHGLQLEYGSSIAPLVASHELTTLLNGAWKPVMIESEGVGADWIEIIRNRLPNTIISLRVNMGTSDWMENMLGALGEGYDNVHLIADYHGRGVDASGAPAFVLDLLIQAHEALVSAGMRDRLTVIGSGGIIQAEHVPKALICGLDAVVLNTPLFIALQAEMKGACVDQNTANFKIPKKYSSEWGVKRLTNLMGCWRDQLLEIMGAMGLREARRLRGELGRAMFQSHLEVEAFSEIEGFQSAEVIR